MNGFDVANAIANSLSDILEKRNKEKQISNKIINLKFDTEFSDYKLTGNITNGLVMGEDYHYKLYQYKNNKK